MNELNDILEVAGGNRELQIGLTATDYVLLAGALFIGIFFAIIAAGAVTRMF